VKAKTEAEMEVKEEAEMQHAGQAPPPRTQHGQSKPRTNELKRKAALHTAWAKQAKARIEAMKIEKKEQEDLLDYQEEEHGGPTWVAAVVPPDATPSTPPDGSVVPPDAAPSTPPDGSETLMAAIALEDAAVAAAAAAAAAQREKEEAAAQMEAEYATAERAAAAKEAARAQTLAAAKALKEAVDEEDLLGLFLSDTDAETDEEQALHTAEHRAELDGIRLPT
jgi:hypothetical protein